MDTITPPSSTMLRSEKRSRFMDPPSRCSFLMAVWQLSTARVNSRNTWLAAQETKEAVELP